MWEVCMDTNSNVQLDQQNLKDNSGLDKKLESKRIILFLVITFLITYSLEIGLVQPLVKSADQQLALLGSSLIATMMFIPAIGVIITRLITKEGFRNSMLQLPKLKSNLGYYLFAWFGLPY